MTKCVVPHSAHTAAVRRKVAECRMKVKSLEHSRKLQKVHVHNEISEDTLMEYSFASRVPYFEDISLAESDVSVDLYSIFSFESL